MRPTRVHSINALNLTEMPVPSGPALLDLIDQACRGSDALPKALIIDEHFEFLRDER